MGELSMLHCSPRFTGAIVVEEADIWAIDRSSFQMVQMKAAEAEMKDRVKYLETLKIMSTFSKEDKEKVAGSMESMRLQKYQTLTTEGAVCSNFYVVYEGTVSVSVGKGVSEDKKAGSGEVLYFGEKFYDREAASGTVQIASESASALVLDRDTLSKVWDRLIDSAPLPGFNRYATMATRVTHASDEMVLKNMAPLRVVGRTNLGAVELVTHKDDLYVLKTMSKGLIVQKGVRQSIMRERRIWMELIHPHIIRCVATFAEPQCLKYLLEAAVGGELSSVYNGNQLFGKPEYAKFYSAGVTLALSHLHKRRVVYRNLKPQNVLINQYGHPKITDMSLAKMVAGHTFTSCGVPDYMAPEVVTGVGHTRAVDWWSLGCLLFELMTGNPPFQSNHPMQIYAKVRRGVGSVRFPETCQGDIKSLIQVLLAPLAIDRLGMGQGGVLDIMKHPWFTGFDWDAMRAQTMPPPYVPPFDVEPRKWKDLDADKLVPNLKHFNLNAERSLPVPVEYEDDLSGWDEGFE